jgi:hypothetical protein
VTARIIHRDKRSIFSTPVRSGAAEKNHAFRLHIIRHGVELLAHRPALLKQDAHPSPTRLGLKNAKAAEKRTMRKLTIVLAITLATATSAGCIGRCRNWFHKGSPCGTAVAPAVLSGPIAMGAPLAPTVQAPQVYCEPSPAVCVPCDPCMQYDPCATTGAGAGLSTGYLGGYLQSAANCDCANGGIVTAPAGTLPPSGAADPGPLAP